MRLESEGLVVLAEKEVVRHVMSVIHMMAVMIHVMAVMSHAVMGRVMDLMSHVESKQQVAVVVVVVEMVVAGCEWHLQVLLGVQLARSAVGEPKRALLVHPVLILKE